ncbi:MAG: NAD(P)-dependent oxidoreductase [Candidatus Tectomicrobia bacterium]|uniref:NAD(P)-dependent oxidoreductase n=1 Tax=Tectimicrobiota bacterium TaxID=2528274 RepID=A0A932CLW0_UNCTE|nr:NAD(P)-dependent oxidoreductase [Candidatus Tectomicrobia bacterium]
MANVLVTGGAGSLGLRLSLALCEKGHQVSIFDLPQCDYRWAEGREDIRLFKGDIRDARLLEEALAGIHTVMHLAALLPPNSERNRERTWEINVGGTQGILDACLRQKEPPHLVFASSVSTYGDTSREEPPLRVTQPQRPLEVYGESKVAAEKVILASSLPYTILRISGIAVPAFLDPPEVWPFMAWQRIEFIAVGDLVTCLVSLVGKQEAQGKILNIAGGPSWQVSGEEYVRRYCETMEMPMEEAGFLDRPGWLDWYDTAESQALLHYQETSLDRFHQLLRAAVEEALA